MLFRQKKDNIIRNLNYIYCLANVPRKTKVQKRSKKNEIAISAFVSLIYELKSPLVLEAQAHHLLK